LEAAIELVIVGEPEPDFDDGGDLVSVGEPVLVFEVLTLPVVVFVIGGVLDSLADKVEVRVAAIVCVAAGDADEVFEGAAVFVYGSVGYIVADGADVTVCRRLACELNDLSDDRVDVFDAVPDVDTTAPTFASCLPSETIV
jgi:hypothetical protein